MANSIAQMIVFLGVPTIAVALFTLLVVLIVALFFHFRSRERIDALKLIFIEMVELAKVNREPHMLELYRTPARKHTGDYPCVFKGNIIGYNRINLYSSFEEMYQPVGDESGDYVLKLETKEYPLSKEEVEEVKSKLSEFGGFLNVVAYETLAGWKIPFIWREMRTRALLCFDDHISGLTSRDGKVILHAEGTESHGFYFEIPTISPDTTKVIISVIKSLTWIRSMTQLQSNMFEVMNQSLNMNPGLLQVLSVKQLEQKISKPVKTE